MVDLIWQQGKIRVISYKIRNRGKRFVPQRCTMFGWRFIHGKCKEIKTFETSDEAILYATNLSFN